EVRATCREKKPLTGDRYLDRSLQRESPWRRQRQADVAHPDRRIGETAISRLLEGRYLRRLEIKDQIDVIATCGLAAERAETKRAVKLLDRRVEEAAVVG